MYIYIYIIYIYIQRSVIPPLFTGILIRSIYKPLRNWVDEFTPYHRETMGLNLKDIAKPNQKTPTFYLSNAKFLANTTAQIQEMHPSLRRTGQVQKLPWNSRGAVEIPEIFFYSFLGDRDFC